jgi:hypothetical protein
VKEQYRIKGFIHQIGDEFKATVHAVHVDSQDTMVFEGKESFPTYEACEKKMHEAIVKIAAHLKKSLKDPYVKSSDGKASTDKVINQIKGDLQ